MRPEPENDEEVQAPMTKRARKSSMITTDNKETQTSEAKKTFGNGPAPKVKDYYANSRRGFTTTLVLPSSIVDNAQSLELKTYLVS